MTDLKQAVTNAIKHTSEVFASEAPKNVRLEEVQRTKREWLITVGFDRRVTPLNHVQIWMETQQGVTYERTYKVVVIDANSGEPTAIKIREHA